MARNPGMLRRVRHIVIGRKPYDKLPVTAFDQRQLHRHSVSERFRQVCHLIPAVCIADGGIRRSVGTDVCAFKGVLRRSLARRILDKFKPCEIETRIQLDIDVICPVQSLPVVCNIVLSFDVISVIIRIIQHANGENFSVRAAQAEGDRRGLVARITNPDLSGRFSEHDATVQSIIIVINPANVPAAVGALLFL